ncbi:MAG: SagB/ThcOx family dehydrogenase [Polyangia bacterium]
MSKLLAQLDSAELALLDQILSTAKAGVGERTLTRIGLIHQNLKASPTDDQSIYTKLDALRAPPMCKEFPGAPEIPLPQPVAPLQQPLSDILQQRTSSRDYGPSGFSLAELSAFLWHSTGLKGTVPAYNIRQFPVRRSPTAGGLQSSDIYLVVNQVAGVDKGLYYYHPVRHTLVQLEAGNLRRHVVRSCIFTEWVGYAPVVFFLVANSTRVQWKYGDRAYRFMHVDAGVLCQNMYLTATALDWNACALAAYYDDAVNSLLSLDGIREFCVLLFAAGTRPFADSTRSSDSDQGGGKECPPPGCSC